MDQLNKRRQAAMQRNKFLFTADKKLCISSVHLTKE